VGIVIRQSFWNSLSAYIGVVLGALMTLWLYPSILSADQYGLTRVLVSVATVSSTFAHLGMRNILLRYFPYFKNENQGHHGLLFWALLVPLLGFVAMAGLYFGYTDWLIQQFSDRSALFGEFHHLVLPLLISLLYYEVINAYARGLQDTVFASVLKDVVLRAAIVVILTLHFFDWIDFDGFMLGFTGIYIGQALLLLGYVLLRYSHRLWPDFSFLNARLVRSMIAYGSFALLGGLTSVIVGNIDILMLGALTDLSSTGIYSIAFYIGSVIQVPQRSIHKIALPLVAEAFKEKRLEDIEQIYKQTSINQLILGMLLLVGIYANLHNIHAILPAEYLGPHNDWVIMLVGLAKLFDMATGINGGIVLTSNYYRADLGYSMILVVTAILTNYLLIPIYGLLGAAIATAFSWIFYNTLKMVYVQYRLRMQPFSLRTIGVLLVGGAIAWGAPFIPMLEPWWLDVLVRSSIISLVFGILILSFRLSPEINNLLAKYWPLNKFN
jgi:O-antigen/teichoic acid export membrane protein